MWLVSSLIMVISTAAMYSGMMYMVSFMIQPSFIDKVHTHNKSL